MNSGLIDYLLNTHPETALSFEGVYPADVFAHLTKTPSFVAVNKRPGAFRSFVVNQDPIFLKGSHWTVFIYPSTGTTEYFDSFGQPPTLVPEFREIIDENGCYFNTKLIQHPFSTVCGQHVLHYILLRSRGYLMSEIINLFDRNDQVKNDVYVNEFVKREFQISLPVFDESFLEDHIVERYRQQI